MQSEEIIGLIARMRLTRSTFAELSGFSRRTIYCWENELNAPSNASNFRLRLIEKAYREFEEKIGVDVNK